MLVIADAEKPVAVAGVMGGEYSGIMDDTNTILFESACFYGPSVRVTSRKLGLRTDASSRYEKGLDPETCAEALERACELVELLGAGEVIGGVIDCPRTKKPETIVPFAPDWINTFLGTDIPQEEMVRILTSVGFEVENGQIHVPSYRGDVEHKADIAEEVARFYGYDNITATEIRGCAQGIVSAQQRFSKDLTAAMLAQGYYEIITYSFISPKYYDKIRMPADSPLRNSVRIRNPLGEDTSIMRTTALPSILEALGRNYNNRNADAALFEIATEYLPQGEDVLPEERKTLVAAAYGPGRDFYTLKGAIEQALQAVKVFDYEMEADSTYPAFHPGRCAKLTLDGQEIGVIGELHPEVLEQYGMGERACAAMLDFAAIFAARTTQIDYLPSPKFPAVQRDLALVCDKATPVRTLEKTIRQAAGKLLEDVTLFDVYEGENIGAGKKSVAYSLTLRAADRTLVDDEVNAAIAQIISKLEAAGAVLRS